MFKSPNLQTFKQPTFINASRARAVVAFAFLSHAERAAV
jgi:hypothetical protein